MDPVYPVKISIPDGTTTGKTIAQLGGNYDSNGRKYIFPIFPINFIAVLNHNLGDISRSETSDWYQTGIGAKIMFNAQHGMSDVDYSSNHFNGLNIKSVINAQNISNQSQYIYFEPQWNGFSIIDFDGDNDGSVAFPDIPNSWLNFSLSARFTAQNPSSNLSGNLQGAQIGSFIVGKYWEPPHSPDLNVRATRSYPNIKKQRTLGGKIVSNLNYDSPAEWYRTNRYGDSLRTSPFELEATTSTITTSEGGDVYSKDYKHAFFGTKEGLGRKGIRSWEFEFSYIQDEETFMAYENSSMAPYEWDSTDINPETGSKPPNDEHNNNDSAINLDMAASNPILNDESFHWVWQHTLGGHIPFLFQPDNTNNNPDQFAICTFRQNSLAVEQVSSSVYKVKVTIDEVG